MDHAVPKVKKVHRYVLEQVNDIVLLILDYLFLLGSTWSAGISSCIIIGKNLIVFIFKGPPGESLLPNRLGPFEQEAEKNDWSLIRLRRSIGQLDDNHIPSNRIGSQLIHILEHMTQQLHEIELPTGLQRDHPVQSCLDLHDRSKSGTQEEKKLSSNQNEIFPFLFRKILD